MAPQNGMEFVAVDKKTGWSGARLGDAHTEDGGAGQGHAIAGGGLQQARPGADFKARLGAARERRGAHWPGEKEQTGCALLLRGEDKPARSCEIIELGGINLADHHRRRPAFQRLFHRPEGVLGIRRPNEDEMRRIDPIEGKARTIEFALFEAGEILADPDQRRLAAAGEKRGKGEDEACRGRRIARRGRGDLMQRTGGEAAGKHRVEPRCAEGHARPCGTSRRRMGRGGDAGDVPAQKAEPLR